MKDFLAWSSVVSEIFSCLPWESCQVNGSLCTQRFWAALAWKFYRLERRNEFYRYALNVDATFKTLLCGANEDSTISKRELALLATLVLLTFSEKYGITLSELGKERPSMDDIDLLIANMQKT